MKKFCIGLILFLSVAVFAEPTAVMVDSDGSILEPANFLGGLGLEPERDRTVAVFALAFPHQLDTDGDGAMDDGPATDFELKGLWMEEGPASLNAERVADYWLYTPDITPTPIGVPDRNGGLQNTAIYYVRPGSGAFAKQIFKFLGKDSSAASSLSLSAEAAQHEITSLLVFIETDNTDFERGVELVWMMRWWSSTSPAFTRTGAPKWIFVQPTAWIADFPVWLE
ncbi:MAG: hypothetical protein AAF555_05675 [Verrucomicrobiota bacterium]